MELPSYKQNPAAVTHTLEGLKRWDGRTIISAPVLSGSATRKIKRIGALSFLGIFNRKAKIEQRESLQTNPYAQYKPYETIYQLINENLLINKQELFSKK